jgi:peptidoglycan hydrolase-like protein with peptidoglycan-binding domain
MLDELRSKLNQGKKYDLVFIYGGTNDMFSLVTKNEAISNIRKMVNLVASQGGKTIVFAGYDAEKVMSEKSHSNGGNLRKTRYCSEECMLKSRKRMIEFQDALPSEISGDNVIVIPKMPGGNPSWAGDGTHVGPSTHIEMANYVNDVILGKIKKSKSTKKSNNLNSLTSFDFLTSLKNVINKYLLKPFGSLFGKKELTKSFVEKLKKISENRIKNNNLIFEEKTLEYIPSQMSTRDDVGMFQVALQLLGHSLDVWGADGKFGPETKQAVKDFQKENGLIPTGKITQSVKDKIIEKVKNDVSDEDFTKINFEKKSNIALSDIEPDIDTDLSTKYKSDSKLSTNRFEKIAYNNYGDEFVNKVKKIGDDIGLDYKIILAIMNFESGINHRAVNPISNATGLIQFMPFTAKSLGTTVGELRNMSAIEQLDYVKKFFNLHRSLIPSIKSPEDAYFLVFYPVAANKDDSFILGSERSNETARLIAKKNPVDANNDGVLSKGEEKAKLRQRWGI